MRHLRVLHVYRTYFPDPPGGLQEAIRQIAKSTKAYGVESRIYTLSPNPRPAVIQLPEGRVVRSRSWGAPASCDLGGLGAFRRFADSAAWADVIHYQFPWPFADLLHVATKPKAPAVVTYQSDIVRQRWIGHAYRPLMKLMLNAMSMIIATSPAYARSSKVLSDPALRDRVAVIPLGIDEHLYPKDGNDEVLRKLKLEPGEPYFLFIGVLRYYKGLHTLLQAAATIKARVVIAGTGPGADALQAQVRRQNIRNVVFAGQVSETEKVALLKHCRAFVLPSHLRSEAFGMVLVEAAMFSKPLVCCEINTGTSFVNLDGQTGFVVPPENPDQLARAMNCFIEDEPLAQAFGQAARTRYENVFSADKLGRAYAALYSKVLERR